MSKSYNCDIRDIMEKRIYVHSTYTCERKEEITKEHSPKISESKNITK